MAFVVPAIMVEAAEAGVGLYEAYCGLSATVYELFATATAEAIEAIAGEDAAAIAAQFLENGFGGVITEARIGE